MIDILERLDGDNPGDYIDEAMDEIRQLRAENERLKALLAGGGHKTRHERGITFSPIAGQSDPFESQDAPGEDDVSQ